MFYIMYSSFNGKYFVQANCAVCKADNGGATALSSAASSRDLYGTQCIGLFSKIRSWKSVSCIASSNNAFYFLFFSFINLIYIVISCLKVAVLQMLEKQMGPEFFRKVRIFVVCSA